jgi:hypothetical protein
MPDARYFSMPSDDVGGDVRRKWALNGVAIFYDVG